MSRQSKKILIVEDELPLLQAISDKLNREGFSALEARDGVEGLEMALKNHPDLILLDIVMPKMDGLTVLKKLREDEWGKDALVIILTNLSDASKVSEALESGGYHYLVKSDWKLEDVVNAVKEKLGM